MNSFSIQNQLTLKDYKKLLFKVTYRKFRVIMYNTLALIFLSFIIIQYLDNTLDSSSYEVAFFILLWVLYFPLTIYWLAYKAFRTKQRITENITYTFTEDGLVMKGESFNSDFTWEKIPKIRRLKNWLLIYHRGSNSFNLIQTTPEDEVHIEELKAYLISTENKIKLKW